MPHDGVVIELQAGDPESVGPYRLRARIGAGGMGVVYLAADPSGREVALKLVREELAADAGFRARFGREVRAGQRVGGTYTAHTLAADVDSPRPYLVSEYVPGGNLADSVAAHGPLSGDTLIALAAGLAEALVAMDRVGVIHRDLKPSNVLIGESGPKIIDFGISLAADGTSLTRPGAVVGSPSWMAPEQAQGREVTAAVDVFSWGATIAFAATGRHPFGEGRPDAVIYRVVHEEPDLVGADPRLVPLVRWALTKDPARRPSPDILLHNVLKLISPTPRATGLRFALGRSGTRGHRRLRRRRALPRARQQQCDQPNGGCVEALSARRRHENVDERRRHDDATRRGDQLHGRHQRFTARRRVPDIVCCWATRCFEEPTDNRSRKRARQPGLAAERVRRQGQCHGTARTPRLGLCGTIRG